MSSVINGRDRGSVEKLHTAGATVAFDNGERLIVESYKIINFHKLKVNDIIILTGGVNSAYRTDAFETEKRRIENEDLFNKLRNRG